MRKIMILLMLALLVCARAEEQVIWKLDETNTAVDGKKSWYSDKPLVVEPLPEGGFALKSQATRRLLLQPDAWLVFELAKAEIVEPGKYTMWSMHVHTDKYGYIVGSDHQVPLGLHTIKLNSLTKPMTTGVIFYNYNLNLYFKYIKLVTEPENSLCAIVPEGKTVLEVGDKITILLKLKEPCEDVSCKLMQNRFPFSLNGTDAVDLKAVDDDCKIWRADITIKSYQSKRPVGMRGIRIKASVLGGKLNMPIYGVIPAAFKKQ
ncbi:MAG: hypothetical protein J5746_14780 [Victivallales bacterium]|nr:hypothetical protein [Victivallales bacterium]